MVSKKDQEITNITNTTHTHYSAIFTFLKHHICDTFTYS